jgi:fructose-1,6-bisphosphatase/inositol monophosphatase family enzyme
MPLTPTPSLDDDLALALRLADEASAVALAYFEQGVGTRRKGDGTVVTDADVEVERLLTAALAAERPGDAVLGEELGGSGHSPRRWILDPIDGTRNFVAGRPDWGVHIALEDAGDITVGVVTRPVLAARWWAGRGRGAFSGLLTGDDPPKALRVSSRERLADGRVSAWVPIGDQRDVRLRSLPGWIEPLDLDLIMRVAEGGLEVLIDRTASQIWDRAPLVVLVEEAGGRYQDSIGGRDLNIAGGRFSNGHIDAELDRFLDGREA